MQLINSGSWEEIKATTEVSPSTLLIGKTRKSLERLKAQIQVMIAGRGWDWLDVCYRLSWADNGRVISCGEGCTVAHHQHTEHQAVRLALVSLALT